MNEVEVHFYGGPFTREVKTMRFDLALDLIHPDAAVLWDRDCCSEPRNIESVWVRNSNMQNDYEGRGEVLLPDVMWTVERGGSDYFRFYAGKDWRGWVRVTDGIWRKGFGRDSAVTNEWILLQVAIGLPKWLHGEDWKIDL